MSEKNNTIHLVKDGDSLLAVACGIKVRDGMEAHFEAGMVTCGACKKTKMYKELVEAERKDREYPLINVNTQTEVYNWTEILMGAKVVGVMESGVDVSKVVALKLEKDKKFYWVDKMDVGKKDVEEISEVKKD